MAITKVRSKVDWWLACTAAMGAGAPGVIGVLNILSGGGRPKDFVLVAACFFAIALVCTCAIPMYYELSETALVVRAGLLKRRIKYADISEVRPTRNPLSSWAWSLDRLEISLTDSDHLMISPVQKWEFMAALLKRVPRRQPLHQ